MKRNITNYIFLLAFGLFGVFGFLTLRDNFNDPQQVFYGMIENSLSINGLSRTTSQENSDQKIVQITQLQTGAVNGIVGETQLSQGTGEAATKITTESIGTPQQDFVRYANIETGQLGNDGTPLDFSSVVGVWGRSQADNSIERGGELFSEAVLGVVPVGNLSKQQRSELIDEIKKLEVYNVDFSKVERSINGGRPTYVYDTQIKTESYVRMLQVYGKMIQTNQLQNINPENFAKSPPIDLRLEVDVWSRQLRTVWFVDTDRVEKYDSYGLIRELAVPGESIPVAELQQRLQTIQ